MLMGSRRSAPLATTSRINRVPMRTYQRAISIRNLDAPDPARADHVPYRAGDEQRCQQNQNRRPVEAADPLLDRLAGEIARASHDQGPQQRADEVEDHEAPHGD